MARDGKFDVAQLGGRGMGLGKIPVSDGVRARWGSIGGDGGLLLFADDQFTLASSTPTLTLTYLPLPVSVTVYLNGIAQLEGTDWSRVDQDVTVDATMGAVSGDILEARYCYARTDPLPSTVYEAAGGLADTFDRADGTADVALRSDGGLWDLSSDIGDVDRWEIDGDKLIKLTDGYVTSGYYHWVKADYGDLDEFTIEVGIYSPNPFGHQWINLGSGPDNDDDATGIEIYLGQYEQYTTIQAPRDGTYVYNTSFTIHNWEVGDTTTVHPMTITYSRLTGHLMVDFEGEVVYDDDTGYITPGTFLGLGCDKTGNGFAYVTLTAGI